MEERNPSLLAWLVLVGGFLLLTFIIPLLWWYWMYAQLVLTSFFLLGAGVATTYSVRTIVQNLRQVVLSIASVRESFLKVEKLKIANQREMERLAFDRLMQPLVIEAIAQGKNFTYSAKGEIMISDWKSNVHTMPSSNDQGGYGTQRLLPSNVTVEQEVEADSYRMIVGTCDKTGEPVKVSFKGRHLKFVGTSQMGKSSLICYLLESIMQSHSPTKFQIALLDLEGLNSNLLKSRSHVYSIAQFELKPIVAGIETIVGEMNKRYAGGAKAMSSAPLLLVYIEEYLDLVNQLKLFDKDLFAKFSSSMTTLAVRGLKANIVLWLSMQTNYSDDQLKEALANIPYGHCLALTPNAGRAAGFPDNDLLKENFRRATPGTSYARYPEYKGLITHFPYDIKAKLNEYEEVSE
jgi:hypothetical protein